MGRNKKIRGQDWKRFIFTCINDRDKLVYTAFTYVTLQIEAKINANKRNPGNPRTEKRNRFEFTLSRSPKP